VPARLYLIIIIANVPYTKSYGSTSWRCSCSNEQLTIPVEVVKECGLNDRKPFDVNVGWEVANDTHPRAFAAMAEEGNDGRQIGILVSKNSRDHWVHYWIVRTIPSAVPWQILFMISSQEIFSRKSTHVFPRGNISSVLRTETFGWGG